MHLRRIWSSLCFLSILFVAVSVRAQSAGQRQTDTQEWNVLFAVPLTNQIDFVLAHLEDRSQCKPPS
jgi:hypothetical protein